MSLCRNMSLWFCPTPTWSTCLMRPASTSPSSALISSTGSVWKPWRRSSSRTCRGAMALPPLNTWQLRTTASHHCRPSHPSSWTTDIHHRLGRGGQRNGWPIQGHWDTLTLQSPSDFIRTLDPQCGTARVFMVRLCPLLWREEVIQKKFTSAQMSKLWKMTRATCGSGPRLCGPWAPAMEFNRQ